MRLQAILRYQLLHMDPRQGPIVDKWKYWVAVKELRFDHHNMDIQGMRWYLNFGNII